MTLTVREMRGSEVGLIIEYFFQSTPEYLEILGVDPSRLPAPESWRDASASTGRSRSNSEPELPSSGCRTTGRLAFRPPTRSLTASKPTCTCT
jgi:hypothetical protein